MPTTLTLSFLFLSQWGCIFPHHQQEMCGGHVMKGSVCSTLYNGTFVPGHGENITETTVLLYRTTAFPQALNLTACMLAA